MSIPSTKVKGLLVGGSSLIVTEEGRSKEGLRVHQGLIKNSGGSSFDVLGIPTGIMGLLPHILHTKAQQP